MKKKNQIIMLVISSFAIVLALLLSYFLLIDKPDSSISTGANEKSSVVRNYDYTRDAGTGSINPDIGKGEQLYNSSVKGKPEYK